MTIDDQARRAEFFALVQRYNQLGAMLPESDEIDKDEIDDIKLVLKEMATTMSAIDALLAAQCDSQQPLCCSAG